MTDSAISVSAAGLPGRYAAALFDLARDEKTLDETAAALAKLKAALGESEDLRILSQSQLFSRADVARAVDAIASALRLPTLTKKFLGVLAQNGRLSVLPGIVSQFEAMLARYNGTTSADVVSAQPLTDDQVQALEAKLNARTGRQISAHVTVDPELLGGLIVRIGSQQIDSSVRTRLERLGQQMKG